MADNNNKRKWTRRGVLKLGAAGGLILSAPYVATSRKSALIAEVSAGLSPGGGTSTTASPPTTPFVAPLPIPPVAQPVPSLSPAPDTSKFQHYSSFPAKEYYDIDVKEALHSFHPELPLNTVWGYNGVVPGPHFVGRYGRPMIVRFRNNLPASSTGFGDPSIITHLHNGHSGSESDGFTGDFYPSGQYRDHHYPHMLAGGDPNEALGTLLYHDHRVDFTAANTYKGLVGTLFLFDEVDSGDESDTNPLALRLPSGEYDVPLFLADKQFDANGALVFDQTDLNGFIGDKFTVNGMIQPYFKVARRKYRFRVMTAGPARFYGIKLSTGQSFKLIATDGNLLPAPITMSRFVITPGERFDIVVDFSQYRIGDQIVLENDVAHSNGRGPSGTLATPIPLLRFDVDRDVADVSQVPAALRPLPVIDTSRAVTTRNWTFQNIGGAWTINGRVFDLNRVDAVVKKGTAEIWNLNNPGALMWSHPIHIHLEEFRILSRGGATPPPHERGRKDVVSLSRGGAFGASSASIFIQFRDMEGKYLMHCHNTVHEDHAMMVRFDIVP